MALINVTYGTNGQAITITLASLASAGQRQSTVIDNTSNKFLDAYVFLVVKTGSSLGTNPIINVYAFGTADGGTNYSDNAGASDAAITLTAPPNMPWIGLINTPSATTTYKGGPFAVAPAFGGTLPDHWGIVVENKTGATLDSTEGNFTKVYQGVYAQAV